MNKYEILAAVTARMHIPTAANTILASALDHVFSALYAAPDIPESQLRELRCNKAAMLEWQARVHAAMSTAVDASPEIASLPQGLPEIVIVLVVSQMLASIDANSFPWILGLEWYADETEHQLTGEVLARADTSEQLEHYMHSLIELAKSTAKTPRPGNIHDTNTARAITTGECWLHLTKVSDLKSKPKTMFDAPTVDDVGIEPMPLEPQDSAELSQFGGTEKFFNIRGEVRESLPEVWALQAGVY